MYHHFKTLALRYDCVLSFFESPQRRCRQEDKSCHDCACGDCTAFAVAFAGFSKFKGDAAIINRNDILHGEGELPGTAPTTALLRFCYARSNNSTSFYHCFPVDDKRENRQEGYSVTVFEV